MDTEDHIQPTEEVGEATAVAATVAVAATEEAGEDTVGAVADMEGVTVAMSEQEEDMGEQEEEDMVE